MIWDCLSCKKTKSDGNNYKNVIFEDGNSSSDSAKNVKAFLREKNIDSIK